MADARTYNTWLSVIHEGEPPTVDAQAYGTWLSVAHEASTDVDARALSTWFSVAHAGPPPASAEPSGLWATVVHDVPPIAEPSGLWATVVHGGAIPTFSGVVDVTDHPYGTAFDPLPGVSAQDSGGTDLTSSIQVSGSVDVNQSGTYSLTYSVTDSQGNTAQATRNVTVSEQQVEPDANQPSGAPMSTFVSRNVPLGSDAVWGFQMAAGRAGNIQVVVYQQDTQGAITVLGAGGTVAESATAPGTYTLTVAAANMTADNLYFATVQDGDQFARLQTWSYANSSHFDAVLDGQASLQTSITNETDAIDAALVAAEAARAAMEIALTAEIDANEAKIDDLDADLVAARASIEAKVDDLDADLVAARASIEAKVDDLDADLVALDGKVDTNHAALVADTEDIQASLGDLQNLSFTIGGVPTAQNDLAGALQSIFAEVDGVEEDIASAKTDIIADIAAAKTFLDGEITAAETLLSGAISASEGVVTGAISAQTATLQGDISTAQSNITGHIDTLAGPADGSVADSLYGKLKSLDTLIKAETDAIDATLTALDGKVDANHTAVLGRFDSVDSAVADLDADVVALDGKVDANHAAELLRFDAVDSAVAAVKADTASIEGKLDTEIAAASAERALQVAERAEQDAFRDATAASLADLDGDVAAAKASIEGKIDTLEGANAARHTADLAEHTATQNLLGTPADGTISQDIANLKAAFDAQAVVNARLQPFVPSEMISPLMDTTLRFTCNVLDGSTGALEMPDNNELGVIVQRNKDGELINVSPALLSAAGGEVLPSAPGGDNRIPTTFRLMSPVSGQAGRFEAFLPLPALEHGNYEFEFAIYDSDPSNSPVSYTTIRYMVVRKAVQFSFAGAF